MAHATVLLSSRAIAALIAAALGLSTAAGASIENPIIYTAEPTSPSTIRDRGPSYAPTYFVYADKQRNADEAKQLIADLGMMKHLDEYKARAFVIGPANGEAYDTETDLTAFQNLLRNHRSSNLKIVAVGAGATFVNNVIAKYDFAVAGIFTYGGSIEPGLASDIPVPIYVHSSNPEVAKVFIQANGATVNVNSAAYTTYTNPQAGKSLQRVVVSKLDDSKESPDQAFQNAWKTVFSKNYRLYMTRAESYSQGFDPNNYTEPWELEPYVMYDELGVRYEAVVEDLPDLGHSLRYEYVPEKALKAATKSVPLVIMMHGNNNDPRIQGESSGWVEVAAKNTIILTSVEWQGRTTPDKEVFAAIGEKGTMTILDRMLAKYPQIDPGRVYFTGLSAGAMNSLTYGLHNVGRIAGIAAASAPFGPPTLLEAAQKAKADGSYLPAYSIAGTKDMYHPLPANDTPRSFYTAIRSYAMLDDITVPQAPDLSVNELFGLKLDGPGWSEFAGRRAMIGTLSNSEGVMIKLVALDPYGHWNFKPAAEDMWAFLSRFRRDTATGKLVPLRPR
jgi:dienelactone hydrolase